MVTNSLPLQFHSCPRLALANPKEEVNVVGSMGFCDFLEIVFVEELMPVEKDTTDSGVHARTCM